MQEDLSPPQSSTPLVATKRQGPQVKKEHIASLDGLRTVSNLTVVLWHQAVFGHVLQHVAARLMSFFFILSGFIRLNTTKQEFNLARSSSYVARVLARLAPPYQLCLLIAMALLTASGEFQHTKTFVGWPASALYLQGWFGTPVCGGTFLLMVGNSVSWFVADTIFCSMVFPIFFNLRPQGVAKVLAAIFVTLVVSFAVQSQLDQGFGHIFVLFRLLEFVLGMLMAQLTEDLPMSMRAWRGWGYLFDATVIIAYPGFEVVRYAFFPGQGDGPYSYLLNRMIMSVLVMSACCSYQHPNAADEAPSGFFSQVLAGRPLAPMAKYSYGAYIYQWVPRWTYAVTPLAITGLAPVSYLGAVLPRWLMEITMTWVLAISSEHLFEAPIRKAAETRIAESLQKPMSECERTLCSEKISHVKSIEEGVCHVKS